MKNAVEREGPGDFKDDTFSLENSLKLILPINYIFSSVNIFTVIIWSYWGYASPGFIDFSDYTKNIT